jgi:hypothetical protein
VFPLFVCFKSFSRCRKHIYHFCSV